VNFVVVICITAIFNIIIFKYIYQLPMNKSSKQFDYLHICVLQN